MTPRLRFVLLLGALTVLMIGCRSRGTQVQPTDDTLCQEFARLKNAGDTSANALLAPGPDLTQNIVDEDAKEAFDAASVLRGPFEVVEVRPDDSNPTDPRFVLVLRGGVAIPRVDVRSASGEVQSPGQRMLLNPEVLVEVREGKIHPVKVGLPRVKPRT
jgi:hypothetical protein